MIVPLFTSIFKEARVATISLAHLHKRYKNATRQRPLGATTPIDMTRHRVHSVFRLAKIWDRLELRSPASYAPRVVTQKLTKHPRARDHLNH